MTNSRSKKLSTRRGRAFGHRTVAVGKITSFRRRLRRWWQNERREFPWRQDSTTSYEYVVSEVLLQRTRAENVLGQWKKFFARFPDWESLSGSSTDEIGSYLIPLGLANQRAPRLHALAENMVQRKGIFPREREDIELLPSVGQYIANAIMLFCHGSRQPLMDVNMARVLERVFGSRRQADIRYDPYLQQLSRELIDSKDSLHLNWAVLDFAAKICLARNPRCGICPMADICLYAVKNKRVKRVSRRLRRATLMEKS